MILWRYMEPDIPTRGGRMSHRSLLDSGICVMHMFDILDIALDIQSAVRRWIHVVHVRACVRGQKLSGTAQFSNQRQSPRSARDHRRSLGLALVHVPTACDRDTNSDSRDGQQA